MSPVQKCHQTVCVPQDRHVTELASTSRKKSRKFIQQQTSAKKKAGDLQWCGWRQQQHVRAKKVHATVNTVPQEKLIPFKFALYGMDWNGEMCPKWTHQEAGPTANPNYHTDWGNNIHILRGHHIPEKTSKWAPQFLYLHGITPQIRTVRLSTSTIFNLAGDLKRSHGHASQCLPFLLNEPTSGHILVCSMPLSSLFLHLAATAVPFGWGDPRGSFKLYNRIPVNLLVLIHRAFAAK